MVSATRARRVKRDSAPNLYRQCQVTGNCPPDVVNKVEGTTLADRLLKIFSSIIYLGGLGIGTGKGAPDTLGYGPVNPGGGRVTGTGTVMRPGVAVEPIGPADIVPVDSVGPGDSSIVPLLEATPDVPINGGPEVPPQGPDISTVDVTSSSDSVSDVIVQVGGPIHNPDSAVIDVQPAPGGPRRVTVTRSTFNNPSYVSVQHPAQGLGEGGGVILGEGSGTVSSTHEIDASVIVGGRPPPELIFDEPPPPGDFEEIELDTFVQTSGSGDFEGPLTSTPRTPLQRAATRFRDLYHRTVQQVRVTNQDQFLSQPSRAVTFENPAFEDDADISLIYGWDAAVIEAAPDPDFMDIIRLGRQRLSEIGRSVRVSRLGQRASMKLRSGLQIGGRAHFFTDISPIATENIELSTLGEVSGMGEMTDGLGTSSLIDEPGVEPIPLEHDLADNESYDFSGSRLEFTFSNGSSRFTLPDFVENYHPGMYTSDINTGLHVIYPHDSEMEGGMIDPDNVFPPTVIVYDYDDSVDFYLHPSLKRRKKRKYIVY
ncbi:L2 [Apodemus sylvaticus papillomavirus 1]|uniref:Minor capsid protein L2 n=1 Tax=Apodemus sylvaticus papillomavirus 1 TaxID=1036963 RepID=F8SIM8_9PAPI|nr:L2 [Apodemus sylvaticus papillomavirus 1]AEI00712.1 L2 [Apodemus sylvaticus papillomavirus 1]